ncbi:hypothetical protein ENBRE01_1969 [Enteropsectra breve]|nr:hypothetical protein ENBRE01_1969 [Enteropsectra breve]
MKPSFSEIEQNIKEMDDKYDANFGEWIKNEENSKIIGYNLRKYIDRYSVAKTTPVVQWIINDWTLRGIILFSERLLSEDLVYKRGKAYAKRISILLSIMLHWNAIFIACFISSISSKLDIDSQTHFYTDILKYFSEPRLRDILVELDHYVLKEQIKGIQKRLVKQRGKLSKKTELQI